jgi:hypothetical protein
MGPRVVAGGDDAGRQTELDFENLRVVEVDDQNHAAQRRAAAHRLRYMMRYFKVAAACAGRYQWGRPPEQDRGPTCT